TYDNSRLVASSRYLPTTHPHASVENPSNRTRLMTSSASVNSKPCTADEIETREPVLRATNLYNVLIGKSAQRCRLPIPFELFDFDLLEACEIGLSLPRGRLPAVHDPHDHHEVRRAKHHPLDGHRTAQDDGREIEERRKSEENRKQRIGAG